MTSIKRKKIITVKFWKMNGTFLFLKCLNEIKIFHQVQFIMQ